MTSLIPPPGQWHCEGKMVSVEVIAGPSTEVRAESPEETSKRESARWPPGCQGWERQLWARVSGSLWTYDLALKGDVQESARWPRGRSS